MDRLRAEDSEFHEYRLRARQWLAGNLPLAVDGGAVGRRDVRLERLGEFKALQQKLYDAGYAGFTFPRE